MALLLLINQPGVNMPRKSRQLRMDQASLLYARWSNSVFANDYRHRFIRDMSMRLIRNKGLSTKQRNWLDQLIEEGVPEHENANPGLTEQCNVAIAAFKSAGSSYAWELGVVEEFRTRVALGKNMSEKQTAFLKRLLDTGSSIANGDFWSPNEDESAELKNAVKLYNGYSAMWKDDRPGVHRALLAVKIHFSEGTPLKQNDAKKLLHAVRGQLKRFKNPRFQAGAVGKVPANNPAIHNPLMSTSREARSDNTRLHVICMSPARVSEAGAIVNDWLLPSGQLVAINHEHVAKR